MNATQFFDMLHARRRYHLRRLIGENQEHREVAERLGMHPGYFCGLLAGSRPFCEKRARKIEEHFGIPFGSMDLEVS